MELNEILKVALKGGASDIHLKPGLPPCSASTARLVPLKNADRLAPDEVQKMAFGIMNPVQKQRFDETTRGATWRYGIAGLGRFRVNVFQQRGTIGIVFRVIPFGVKSIEQLVLPKVHRVDRHGAARPGPGHRHHRLGQVDLARRDDRLHQHQPHLSHHDDRGPDRVPDPGRRSIVNQREIGVDTQSFANALRAALRQDPDVILVGEMRDFETIETAITAAETGHLVLAHAAHPGRHRDHQPHHLRVPALPAEAGAHPARVDPEGGDLASAWCPAPTARAAYRRWRC